MGETTPLGAAAPGEAPVQVLLLAGSGRSGTTVVTKVLGQLPGCFAAGEVRYVWERGVVADQLCSCGLAFSRCPVWASVARRSLGGDGDGSAVARRLRRRLRIRRLPLMAVRRALGRAPVPPHRDDEVLCRLYRELAGQTGARVLVDSSKLPPYGLLLAGLRGVELTVLHLVRDPRATAYSWRRQRPGRDAQEEETMARLQTWKSSLLWLLWNLVTATAWRASSGRVLRVRYEDLVASPREVLTDVARLVGVDGSALPLVGEDRVEVGPSHLVAGNPNRHDSGVVVLREDDEWRRAMPRRHRLLATVLTAPALTVFGYPLGTGARPGATSAGER